MAQAIASSGGSISYYNWKNLLLSDRAEETKGGAYCKKA